ncbi:hypothetical protein DPMN_069629 [Dreissena polymorpha]|uniref:Uncharacterized protein n=1 Tax=Dreissena polymorpha TaxID=45954 RepID=A0A9D3YZG8_DREPO|nr:hypothetical protein DPMN_069629 [Dreissena polymorpha]
MVDLLPQNFSGCPSGFSTPPVSLNLFLEKIMQQTLHRWHIYLQLEIYHMGGTSTELQELTNKFYKRTGAFVMDVSTAK